MGRIQSSPSPPPPFQPNQPPQMVESSEYDLQPQEYQYDPHPPPPQQEDSAATQEENAHTSNYEINIPYTTDQNQEQAQYNFQQQLQQPPPQQQPFQPPPPPPQNPQTTPNLAYQSTQPVQNPVHSHQNPPQMNNIHMYANQQQPAAALYPPQSQQPSQTSTYPPKASAQAYPSQPVQFPPQIQQAVQFSPQNGAAPAAFPPPQQMQYGTQNGGQGYMLPSPHKPTAAFNGSAQGIPIHMNPMQQPVATEGWRTGLFDCMDDPMNAVVTAFFPCLTFGQIAEIIDNGHTSCGTSGLLYGLIACLIGLPCIMSCTYRTKLRGKYGLVESPAPDWVSHFLCEWCALCQEYRELQLRGLDPSIGWQGNVAMNQGMQLQQQGAMMRPPMNQRMG